MSLLPLLVSPNVEHIELTDSSSIPIVVAALVFVIVIQKRKRKQRVEDMNDKHRSLDFGMGEVHSKKGGKKGKNAIPEMTVTDMSTENMIRGRGISVDLGSPYVMAGELQASKASFDSASKSIHDDADPYRPIRSASKSPARAQAQKADSEKQTLLGNAQTPSSNTPRSASPVNSPVGPPPPAYNGNSVSRKPVGPGDSKTPLPPPPPPKTDEDRKATSNFSIPRNVDRSSISSKSSRTNPEGGRKSPPPPLPKKQPRMGSIDTKVNDPLPADGIENYNSYTDMLGISGGPQNTRQPAAEQQPRNDGNLAVPSYNDPRRLSASLRPLPPEDPTDNAEQRANRIRSFYKEYFDESKPAQDQGYDDYYGFGEYYDDYEQEHLNGATIWDPETGQFVTAGAPYAEPVTRRAMTPPPRGPPRFRPGPGGHRYTSSSGHSHGPHGRAHSSASNRHPGARGRPVKKLPPPKPLNNLPTPHHLKDDMTTLPAMDFAPPVGMRDRIAGRADSPGLEQRPYSPSVRAFTPLKSSFKELTVMPSPHSLRKSGTFTALDFAPPPKIHDRGAGGSDTSSIRSGRSGISAMQAHNVRAGNYRVSRIGNQNLGTKDDIAAALKPQWNIGRT